jgi:hypothetical protein
MKRILAALTLALLISFAVNVRRPRRICGEGGAANALDR